MNNTTLAYCLIITLTSWILCTTPSSGDDIALRQVEGTEDTSTAEDKSSSTEKIVAFPTFSAVGKISSLNFDNYSIPDMASAQKIVLSGDWNLNVNDGNLSFFEADFVAAPTDGSTSHTHQITNLVPEDSKPIQVASNGNTSISGNADVKIEGMDAWREVHTTITIFKGSTITIVLNDKDTQHHFMRQPIYGIVDRLMY